MFYVVECLRTTGLRLVHLTTVQHENQLTDCKLGRMRNFGFEFILCSFFFKRVPSLSPRVDINPHDLDDLDMTWCTEVMQQLEGGRVPTPYNDEFFHKW
jgi:hypothetical protein